MSEEDADLALLAAANALPVHVAPFNDYQAVCLFLGQHGVEKGNHRGVEVCTLYRLYTGWFEGQAEGMQQVRPYSFARQLKRIGFRKKHDGGRGGDHDTMVLLVNKPGAAFLRAWRTAHPDTKEYRKWFLSKFMTQRDQAREEKE